MNQFTDSQKKIFLTVGVLDLIAVIVILGIIIGAGKSDFPIAIPILLLIPGIVMLMLGLRK